MDDDETIDIHTSTRSKPEARANRPSCGSARGACKWPAFDDLDFDDRSGSSGHRQQRQNQGPPSQAYSTSAAGTQQGPAHSMRPPTAQHHVPHSSHDAPDSATHQASTEASSLDHAALLTGGKLSKVGHYALLGVQKKASESDIKRAFHQLSRKWHPDKNPDNKEQADAIFRAVKEAYECLSDSAKRRRYDTFFAP